MNIQNITDDSYRIVIPFLDIYTTVFILKTPDGVAVFDTATYDTDMDQYLFPALKELGVEKDQLKYVFISHNHRDHAGGLARFMEEYPATTIVARSDSIMEKYTANRVTAPEDGDLFLGCLRVVTIPGHTMDALAVYDIRSKTLFSGDCLQAYGIYGSGKWASNIRFPQEYFPAIEKVRGMEIETIVAAHNYHPCDYMATGKEQVARYLRECEIPLERIAEEIRRHPDWQDGEIAEYYTNTYRLPTLARVVVTAVREAMDVGNIAGLTWN